MVPDRGNKLIPPACHVVAKVNSPPQPRRGHQASSSTAPEPRTANLRCVCSCSRCWGHPRSASLARTWARLRREDKWKRQLKKQERLGKTVPQGGPGVEDLGSDLHAPARQRACMWWGFDASKLKVPQVRRCVGRKAGRTMRVRQEKKVETSGAVGDSADRRAWHAGSGPGPEPTRQPPTLGREGRREYLHSRYQRNDCSRGAQRAVGRACSKYTV